MDDRGAEGLSTVVRIRGGSSSIDDCIRVKDGFRTTLEVIDPGFKHSSHARLFVTDNFFDGHRDNLDIFAEVVCPKLVECDRNLRSVVDRTLDTMISEGMAHHTNNRLRDTDTEVHKVVSASTCFLAYGQTNSGKTHTIFGSGLPTSEEFSQELDNYVSTVANFPRSSAVDSHRVRSPSMARVRELSALGLVPLTGLLLLARFGGAFEVIMIEVYEDRIFDLLNGGDAVKRGYKSTVQSFIDQVEPVVVETVFEWSALLESSIKTRKTSSNNINVRSSRSHAIIVLQTRVQTSLTLPLEGQGASVVSAKCDRHFSVCFVDLAGSERQHAFSSGLSKESIGINKSLSHLSTVLEQLGALADATRTLEKKIRAKVKLLESSLHSDPRSTITLEKIKSLRLLLCDRVALREKAMSTIHIQFRGSVLTALLEQYLTGLSDTTFIACVHPHESQYSETVSTLRFLEKLKKVETSVGVTHSKTLLKEREVQVPRVEQPPQPEPPISSSPMEVDNGTISTAYQDVLEAHKVELASIRQRLEEECSRNRKLQQAQDLRVSELESSRIVLLEKLHESTVSRRVEVAESPSPVRHVASASMCDSRSIHTLDAECQTEPLHVGKNESVPDDTAPPSRQDSESVSHDGRNHHPILGLVMSSRMVFNHNIRILCPWLLGQQRQRAQLSTSVDSTLITRLQSPLTAGLDDYFDNIFIPHVKQSYKIPWRKGRATQSGLQVLGYLSSMVCLPPRGDDDGVLDVDDPDPSTFRVLDFNDLGMALTCIEHGIPKGKAVRKGTHLFNEQNEIAADGIILHEEGCIGCCGPMKMRRQLHRHSSSTLEELTVKAWETCDVSQFGVSGISGGVYVLAMFEVEAEDAKVRSSNHRETCCRLASFSRGHTDVLHPYALVFAVARGVCDSIKEAVLNYISDVGEILPFSSERTCRSGPFSVYQARKRIQGNASRAQTVESAPKVPTPDTSKSLPSEELHRDSPARRGSTGTLLPTEAVAHRGRESSRGRGARGRGRGSKRPMQDTPRGSSPPGPSKVPHQMPKVTGEFHSFHPISTGAPSYPHPGFATRHDPHHQPAPHVQFRPTSPEVASRREKERHTKHRDKDKDSSCIVM